jgi:hypothetical protein
MSRPSLARALLVTLFAFTALAPAASAQQVPGPDFVASDNVEYLGRLPISGDGTGARIIGKYMYVTSSKSLDIYDIQKDPAHPELVGSETQNVQFENEEVPTNGKLLGISSDLVQSRPECVAANATAPPSSRSAGNCLSLYDVRDPNNVKELPAVAGAGDHTSTCILDCQYFYGSRGTVTDARGALDGQPAKVIGNWYDGLGKNFKDETGKAVTFTNTCHHVREIQPGILLGSCQPIVLMSVRPEDGGDILHPKLLAYGQNLDNRFIHSSRWPNGGTDKFVLVGGEHNFEPQCTDTGNIGAFMVWDGSKVINGSGGFNKGTQMKMLSEVRPKNGTYSDGHSPYNALGCSVHWFEEHATFHNGGLVALAEYENGTRFEQITPEGKIVEQGYFLPIAGSTSAPHWNPYDPNVVYLIDYERGVDIVRWKGKTYAPDVVPDNGVPGTTESGRNRPTEGAASRGECASAAGFESAKVTGAGRTLRFRANLRQKRSFSVELFQQSTGSKVLDNRLRGRFTNRRRSFTWKAGRSLSDGYYFARFRMKLPNGLVDNRRITLRRVHGRFVAAKDFYQRTDCGAFKSFKLSSSVFGGSARRSLGVAYQLARGARSVSIQVRVGKRVVKTFKGGGTKNRTYRFKVAAGIAKKGQTVAVRATPDLGSPVAAETLYAKRL